MKLEFNFAFYIKYRKCKISCSFLQFDRNDKRICRANCKRKSKYDTVFIGSPVCSNDLANPVETWMNLNQKEISRKTIIPFCTYWSTGKKETLDRIETLCNSKNTKKGIGQSHGEKIDVKKALSEIGF